MLKKVILGVLLMMPIMMMAQEKIAYLNSQEIMFKMPEVKDVEAKLSAKGETLKKSLDAIQAEYQTKLEEYGKKLELFQKGSTDVSESQLLDMQNNLQQLQQRYETHAQTTSAEYDKFQQSLLMPLQQKVQKAIQQVGEEQKYTYIIETSALLYVSESAIDAGKFVKAKLGIKD